MSFANALRRRRGTGWIENPNDRRDWDFEKLGFGSANLPDKVDMSPHVRMVFDQGSTNSCVANAVVNGIQIGRAVQFGDTAQEEGSRLWAYYMARAYIGAQRRDNGCHLRDCMKGIVKMGLPPESVWRFTSNPLKVNKRPPRSAMRAAYDQKGPKAFYRIYNGGSGRLDAMRSALSQGCPVAFGTGLDKPFLSMKGDSFLNTPIGPIVGRHAMLCVGYMWRLGQLWFLVLNSWGTGYRQGGYFWMNQAWMASNLTTDIQVMDLGDK